MINDHSEQFNNLCYTNIYRSVKGIGLKLSYILGGAIAQHDGENKSYFFSNLK